MFLLILMAWLHNVFNFQRRIIIKLIQGYEQNTVLSLKFEPIKSLSVYTILIMLSANKLKISIVRRNLRCNFPEYIIKNINIFSSHTFYDVDQSKCEAMPQWCALT